jgi:hypothetical protein
MAAESQSPSSVRKGEHPKPSKKNTIDNYCSIKVIIAQSLTSFSFLALLMVVFLCFLFFLLWVFNFLQWLSISEQLAMRLYSNKPNSRYSLKGFSLNLLLFNFLKKYSLFFFFLFFEVFILSTIFETLGGFFVYLSNFLYEVLHMGFSNKNES